MNSYSGKRINRQDPIKSCMEDKLNRTNFINYTANIIDNAPTDDNAFVVAINGRWGEGKTSVKNMIVEKYQNNLNDIIIEYNYLEFQTQTELQKNFSCKIVDSLEKNRKRNSFFYRHNLGFLKTIIILGFFSFLTICLFKPQVTLKNIAVYLLTTLLTGLYFIQTALFGEVIFAKLMESIQKIMSKIELFLKFSTTPKNDPTFNSEKLKKFVSSNFNGDKIIIFIDMFDALEFNQINVLIKFLNINLILPNCVFVLFYDKEIVSKALNTNVYAGDNYLNKLVNLQLDLPLINDRVLFSFLQNELSEKYNINIEFSKRFKFVRNYFSSLNKVYSFLDSFDLNYKITMDSVNNLNVSINRNDFFYLEVLRFFENSLYREVRKNKLLLTCFDNKILSLFDDFDLSTPFTSDRVKAFVRLFKDVNCKDNADNLKELIFDLFPLIKLFISGDSIEENITSKQTVGNYDYFDFYFAYDLSEYTIQRDAFIKISKHLTNNEEFIESFKEVFHIKNDEAIPMFSYKFLMKLNEQHFLLNNLNNLSFGKESEFLKNLIWLSIYSDNIVSTKTVINILLKHFYINNINVEEIIKIFSLVVAKNENIYICHLLEIIFLIYKKYLYIICDDNIQFINQSRSILRKMLVNNFRLFLKDDYLKFLLENTFVSNLIRNYLFNLIECFFDTKTIDELRNNNYLNRLLSSQLFINIKKSLFNNYFDLLYKYLNFVIFSKNEGKKVYYSININNLYPFKILEILDAYEKHSICKNDLSYKILFKLNGIDYNKLEKIKQKDILKKLFILKE